MNVKCFACDVVIEGADADACVEAFVAHGRDSHAWNFPETAVRKDRLGGHRVPVRIEV